MSPTNEAAALPCPFCGTVPAIEEHPPHTHGPIASFMPDHPGSWTIECTSCSAGMIADTRDEVLRIWNRRAPEAQHAAALAAAEARGREEALKEAVEIADRFQSNTDLLMTNPLQSKAAWRIRMALNMRLNPSREGGENG